MSQENVEIVRSHIDAFLHDAARSVSFLDPHVVMDPSRVGGPDAAYGHEAVVRAVRRWLGAFEEYSYKVERVRDLGAGGILALVTETGRGKASGAPGQRTFANLYTLIEGKIVRMTVFPTEAQALEAIGLSE